MAFKKIEAKPKPAVTVTLQNATDVFRGFQWGLNTGQFVDQVIKQITFSDGAGGRQTVIIACLWNTDQERIVRTHSHGLNFIVWNQAITLVVRATDIPQNAVLSANSYIDVCDPGAPIAKQYRIDSAFIEEGIWQIDLQVFRTSNQ